MKIFFDTNVYVSEALTHGAAERVIAAAIDARWKVFHSTYLLEELERVLVER